MGAVVLLCPSHSVWGPFSAVIRVSEAQALVLGYKIEQRRPGVVLG